MKKILIYLTLFLFLFTQKSYAVENPLNIPNNKFGIHILFPSEIFKAAELVNSNGGDWGYVTIPIQSGDKDIDKWQKFMDDCQKLHIIPLVRLATEGDYFNTKVWRKPKDADIVDFANFLNSLTWPTKNRYIIVYNEVNRSDEWGGATDAEEYAVILSYAVSTFKTMNEDFFIISAGMDNAAANVDGRSMNQYDFMVAMNNAVPGIFGQIDAIGSHSYPNPAFSQPPWNTTGMGVSSFKYERNLALELSGKYLSVFITETGWSSEKSNRDRKSTRLNSSH